MAGKNKIKKKLKKKTFCPGGIEPGLYHYATSTNTFHWLTTKYLNK